MELEALKTKFNEQLGNTELQLSDRTLDGLLQDALAEIGDNDALATKEFITRKIDLAKTVAGQINHEVSGRIAEWKKTQGGNPKPTPKPTPKPAQQADPNDNGEPAWFTAYKKEQEEKFQRIEAEKQEADKTAKKQAAVEKIEKSLRSKFKTAGIEENKYIFKQTLRDIEIPDEDIDVDAIAKTVEKAYYSNLKEAGFDTDTPRKGRNGGGGNTAVDAYFEQKKKREKWGGASK